MSNNVSTGQPTRVGVLTVGIQAHNDRQDVSLSLRNSHGESIHCLILKEFRPTYKRPMQIQEAVVINPCTVSPN